RPRGGPAGGVAPAGRRARHRAQCDRRPLPPGRTAPREGRRPVRSLSQHGGEDRAGRARGDGDARWGVRSDRRRRGAVAGRSGFDGGLRRVAKLDHLAIVLRDWRAARDWYGRPLGLRVGFEIPERRTAALQDDAGFTLFVAESDEVAPAASCVLTFQVDDVAATLRRAHAGGRPLRVPAVEAIL